MHPLLQKVPGPIFYNYKLEERKHKTPPFIGIQALWLYKLLKFKSFNFKIFQVDAAPVEKKARIGPLKTGSSKSKCNTVGIWM